MRSVTWTHAPNPWNPARTLTRAEVSDDPHGALGMLIQRLAGEPSEQSLLSAEVGELPFDQVVGAFRARSPEDLDGFVPFDVDDPPPGLGSAELWVVFKDHPLVGMLIHGDELRALVATALATLPGAEAPATASRATLLVVGDLPTVDLYTAVAGLDRGGEGRILTLEQRDAPWIHTPRARGGSPHGADPALARALSRALDGFVVLATDSGERWCFFGGLLVEHARGGPPLDELEALLVGPAEGSPLLREDKVSVGAPGEDLDDELPISRVILAGVERSAFAKARPARPGWRWREHTSWGSSLPWIELDGADPLEPEELEELATRFGCAAMAIWIPGRGQPYLWIEAGGGQATLQGAEQGAVALAERLARIGGLCEEAPGALFGRGGTGWTDLT